MISTFIGSGVTLVSGNFISFVLRVVGKDRDSLKLVMIVGEGSVRFVEEVKRVSTYNIETLGGQVYKVCGWETRPLRFLEVEKRFYTSMFFNSICRHTYAYGATEIFHHPNFQEKVTQLICPNCRQVIEKIVTTQIEGTVTEERFAVNSNKEVLRTNNVIVYSLMENVYKVSVCPYTYFSFNEIDRKQIDTIVKTEFSDIKEAEFAAQVIKNIRRKIIRQMVVH